MKKYGFLILLGTALLTLISCRTASTSDVPEIDNGVLDLAGYSFSEDGILDITGEWEFYWEQLLDVNTHSNEAEPSGMIPVPGIWKNYGYPPYGYAGYRLIITNLNDAQIYGLSIPIIAMAYDMWANGDLIAESGTVGTNNQTTEHFHGLNTAYFSASNSMAEIIIHVANYQVGDGGIWMSIRMGTDRQITTARQNKIGWDLFSIGGIFLMGIYHLTLFLIRRKDKASLSFAVVCMIISLRGIFTGQFFVVSIFPDISWKLREIVEFVSFYLGLASFFLFMKELFPQDVNKTAQRIIYGVSVAFSILILFFEPRVFLKIHPFYFIFTGLSVSYLIYVLIRAVKYRREGAAIFIIGGILLLTTVFNDILFSQHILQTGYILSFGLFLFIFFQSFLLSLRFAKAFLTVEELSVNLEKKVSERTVELQDERNKLKQQNDLIENELKLARQIQKQFIPDQSPDQSVAFFYQPMTKVGGDFVDFVRLPNPEKMGVFISDVSGHGVPAAFITSMIKSFSTQPDIPLLDPANYLKRLNDFLIQLTAGNFVTAIYGIYDHHDRTFQYASAGHHSPILIHSGGHIHRLPQDGTGYPLGIFYSWDFPELEKNYRNQTIELSEGEKIFMYTDGVVEAIKYSVENTVQEFDDYVTEFGEKELDNVLKEFSELPPAELLLKIKERLVEFRGSEIFDDDICMVCIEMSNQIIPASSQQISLKES